FIGIFGIKTKSGFGFSLRFKYMGGRPYTPYDYNKSIEYRRGIYDLSMYNKGKLPEYVRLDARVEKDLRFTGVHLNVYLEVENIFDRDNVYAYNWYNRPILEWSILPLLGLSCQF